MKKATESSIVTACLEYLKLRGIWAWRSNNVPIYDPKLGFYRKFRGEPGMSDIIGCLNDGRMLAVEVKRPGEQATDEQTIFIAEINGRGGLAMVVHSIDELVEKLDSYARRN